MHYLCCATHYEERAPIATNRVVGARIPGGEAVERRDLDEEEARTETHLSQYRLFGAFGANYNLPLLERPEVQSSGILKHLEYRPL